MTDHRPVGRVSARIEPFWLNPATIKGTIAVGSGLLLLSIPGLSVELLRFVLAAVFIATGASDVWFGLRRRDPRPLFEGLIAVAFGALLVVVPAATVRTLGLLASIYLAARGLGALVAAARNWRAGQPWATDTVRGLLYATLGVVVLLMADTLVLGLVAVLAAGAVIVGGIMLIYGIRQRSEDELIDIDVASVTEMMAGWLREQDVGDERRELIGDGLFFEDPGRNSKLVSWWVMLMLSVAIATLGVIQDSTAVVIGAMLIAPLMIPILGTSAGMVNVWRGRVWSSALLVVEGALAAIGLSFVIGQWVPIIVPLAENTQVASRVSPNLVDMMIALAAGAAGAYANVDDRVSDSIAGVAIAVALVPPLGVVGLTLQAGMFEDSVGALLLFITNLVSIILAAALVFFLTGYAPYRKLIESRQEVAALLRTVALAAIVIIIPLSITGQDVVSGTARLGIANTQVGEWLSGTELRAVSVGVEGSGVDVFITGPGDIPDVASLEQGLTEEFGTTVSLRVEHAPTTVLTSGGGDR